MKAIFYEVAELVYEKLNNKKYKNRVILEEELIKIWKDSCEEMELKTSMRDKICPKNSFLGVLKSGVLDLNIKWKKDELKGNRVYSIEAIKVLRKEKTNLIARELWEKIGNKDKRHNGQMDVVLAFWDKVKKYD